MSCPACGGDRVLDWRPATASDPQLSRHPSYRLSRCQDCGTAVTVTEGDESRAGLYESGTYGPVRRGIDALIEPLRQLTYRDRSRAVAALPDGARVLELGAGDGAYLEALSGRGFAVRGIEPSATGFASARGRGVPVEHASVESADIPAGSQDAVIMWHVLEHLDRPEDAVRRSRGWLAAGGRLVIGVPNLGSIQAALGGDRWFHQDVPRHRTHFTEAGLRRLLERTGFRVERFRHVVLEHNALGMWQTLLNRLTRDRDVAFRFLKRDLPSTSPRLALDLAVTAVIGPLIALPAATLELAAGAIGRGGTMVTEAVAETAP